MPDAEAPAVALAAVSHRYRAAALADVTLRMAVGSITAVVGPDAVGKSTLLGLIAGVRRLQAGRLSVLGEDMGERAGRARVAERIAYMPQGLGQNLLQSLTVAENLDFFGRLFGQPPAARRARAERLLGATGLAPFHARPAGKLSGGMKQKLSLCCGLIHAPELLILDEPTTGVDPLSRRQFWALLDALRAEQPAMTVIVATAYMEEAERIANLVAMDAGRVLADGPTEAVIAGTGVSRLAEAYVRLQRPGQMPPAPLSLPPRVAQDGPPAILAEGLTRRFGAFTAVDHVSLAVPRGEIFGFLGSNGSGKTTTMKMLTGLLAASEGRAELLGRPVGAADIATRQRIGYMSQGFSLYGELSVRGNLDLHARLYDVPGGEVAARIAAALTEFDLADVADRLPATLPLGVRQRLQLAAACLHRPDVLILDEPTSGVDPAARERFWQHLGTLSRRHGVTIFLSTHFMDEAARCDRISLMHAGRILAVGPPEALRQQLGGATLEDGFVALLQQAGGEATAPPARTVPGIVPEPRLRTGLAASFSRIWAFARREFLALARDPVRLAFALLGPLVLMLTFGFGISFDVEKLPFAVLDRDQSADSRRFIESLEGSRYFSARTPIDSDAELDRRLRAGELRVAVDIPPGFGRDLLLGRRPEIGFILDGAMPFRAETARGYLAGIVQGHAEDLARDDARAPSAAILPEVAARFRYNQAFLSVFAIGPGCIMVLLLLIPAMLAALAVVRERETGSIVALSASPASVGEFLLGKQVPYLVVGMVAFVALLALVHLVFGLVITGSAAALLLGALLYVFAATALGLLVSTLVPTQIAAIIACAIITTVPAINFSGYLYPVASLEGPGRVIGMLFPALWFQEISLGTLAKARPFADLQPGLLVLFGFGVAYLILAALLLRKQER